VLVFDVNDFDEAYLGHFTWDLQRLAASMALKGWTKALPDDRIRELIETYARAYVEQVHYFVHSDRDHEWALRLDTATGAVQDALLDAQVSTRVALLDRLTVVENYRRRFRDAKNVRQIEGTERAAVDKAYERYLETVPESKRMGSISYELKDAVALAGVGIGSAGLPIYSLLVEGHTQALENDVILSLKQGNVAAPSRVVDDQRARDFFEHHGPPYGRVADGAAGARRPLAGLERGRRRRVRRQRGVALLRRPRLDVAAGRRGDVRDPRPARPCDSEGALCVRRRHRVDAAGGVPDRGGDRRSDRR
jgi:uncharacterized protein (DUF2252 family)